MKEQNINTAIKAALVITGVVVAAKNYKRDGFWKGFIASALILGVVSITYKK